ncbi:MAG TPA: hypothetical protein VES65_03465, partial [Solirubrobacteraceae bacterium]|nr:hypothetical protein [Solirubrobacteraceae bacterium]
EGRESSHRRGSGHSKKRRVARAHVRARGQTKKIDIDPDTQARTARLTASLRRMLDGLPIGVVDLDELSYLLTPRLGAGAPPASLPR